MFIKNVFLVKKIYVIKTDIIPYLGVKEKKTRVEKAYTKTR